MQRLSVFACLLAALSFTAAAQAASLTPPQGRTIRVAIVLTDGSTMIDFAGPWEVFQDAMTKDGSDGGEMVMPFELMTVGASHDPVRISGGMMVVPQYSFSDAPMPDVVLVGAQRGAPALAGWLKQMRAQNRLVLSVCTGAFKLADAGLLDGKSATTHHLYTDAFRKKYPKVNMIEGRRYVQSDSLTFTAGGLTSGIDLALHVVELYFGRDLAQKTADYMEYQSTGWHN